MTAKEVKELVANVDDESLGQVILDQIESDDCDIEDIGGAVIAAFESCENEKELKIADAVLIAITGYSLNSLISFM